MTTGIAGPTSTTDIQVTGSAQNGGPAAGTADALIWQIKNGGSQTANSVVFTNTLPAGLEFFSASPTAGGICSGPKPGAMGGVVTCTVASLAVGQTMVVTVNVVPPSPGSLASGGSATFNGSDTNPANNSFTVVIQAK